MNLPIEDLTPRQIVAELDKYIIGQDNAKRAIAVALRNRFRRQQLPDDQRADILPKNILMIGPTGVGKTEIARRLAQLARAPFVKVEATKFTEVGYVGRDVESMVRDLVATAVRLVRQERMNAVQEAARESAVEKILDQLEEHFPVPVAEDEVEKQPELPSEIHDMFHWSGQAVDPEVRNAHRAKLRAEYEEGIHKDLLIEVEIEDNGSQFLQVFTPQGMEEMGLDIGNLNPNFGAKRSFRKVRVRDAMGVILEQEAERLIDSGTLNREAVERTEQTGIIFLDELDKVAIKTQGAGPDVSREGVQRDLLPIIEGSTVASKFGPVRTDHILFVAAGAFHMSKPSDLIPELQGRLPIRVQLESLGENEFRRILREPKNAIVGQYQKLLAVDGVQIEFEEDALNEVAKVAQWVNSNVENIGARRLHTMMERLLEDILFEAPEIDQKTIRFTVEMVRERLGDLSDDESASHTVV